MKFFLKEIPLNLKVSWKIARGSAQEKVNYLLSHDLDEYLGFGEIALNSYYGDTPEKVHKEFEILNHLSQNTKNPQSLLSHPFTNSFKSALAQSFILKKNYENSYEKKIQTSHSVPILEANELDDFYKNFNLEQFKYIKIKINQDNALKFTRLNINKLKPHQFIRIDANEAFETLEDFLKFAEKTNLEKVQFFEQPFKGEKTNLYKELFSYIQSHQFPMKIILDEHIIHHKIAGHYKDLAHGVNLKFSKSAGIFNLVEQIKQAKDLGLEVMMGCMIESTLGISQSLVIDEEIDYYDLDGHFFVKNEPFHLLSKKDDHIFLARPFSLSQLRVY